MDLELITIEPQNALSVFTTPAALDPYLSKVRQEIDAFRPDISTTKGRAEIKSFAFKITKVKTYLDGAGKALNDVQKEIPKKIDAARKHVRDTLDGWAEEVRQPLTDWEQAEEKRIADHKAAITRMEDLGAKGELQIPSGYMRDALAEVKAVAIGPWCEEFEAAYGRAKDIALFQLEAGIEARERYEAEQAELSALRAAAEARAKKDHEEQIARDAAERARREVEERAAAEARRAEEAVRREREAAEEREQALRRQAEDAERRARETEERLRREAEEAKSAASAEAARREANTRRRNNVHRTAISALVAGGVPQDAAERAIDLIAARSVPNVSITY
ncbi:hypothetical protein V5F38_05295 [Xanthobacter sp. V0B-10]|uniref:hypothetical protein n=1 Tax=Xanthobacter albus TaxID=3119929 RepID=UPI003726B25E